MDYLKKCSPHLTSIVVVSILLHSCIISSSDNHCADGDECEWPESSDHSSENDADTQECNSEITGPSLLTFGSVPLGGYLDLSVSLFVPSCRIDKIVRLDIIGAERFSIISPDVSDNNTVVPVHEKLDLTIRYTADEKPYCALSKGVLQIYGRSTLVPLFKIQLDAVDVCCTTSCIASIPSVVEFGNVEAYSSQIEVPFSLTNVCHCTCGITGLSAEDFGSSAVLIRSDQNGPSYHEPFYLRNNESATFYAKLFPAGTSFIRSSFNGNIAVFLSCLTSNTIEKIVIPVTGTIGCYGSMNIDPLWLQFGNTPVGWTKTKVIEVGNCSFTTQYTDSIQLINVQGESGAFQVHDKNACVPGICEPDQNCKIQITFSPQTKGYNDSDLTIYYHDQQGRLGQLGTKVTGTGI